MGWGQLCEQGLYFFRGGEISSVGFRNALADFLNLPLMKLQVKRNGFIDDVASIAVLSSGNGI
jgi:hypothetical protein